MSAGYVAAWYTILINIALTLCFLMVFSGPAGFQGQPGQNGNPGQPGVPGQTGATGPTGFAGPSGPFGPQGVPGQLGLCILHFFCGIILLIIIKDSFNELISL